MTPGAEQGWRIRARRDPLDFTRWMFSQMRGSKFTVTPLHRKINALFLRVYAGEEKRVIINIMPRSGKTISVAHFIAWGFGQYPDAEWIYSSFSSELAGETSYKVREIVSHPEFARVFPATQIAADAKRVDHWKTTAGGVMYAAGSGGTITGFGAGKKRAGFGGCLVGDDLLKPSEAVSDLLRGKCNSWFSNTFKSRRNSPDTPIIIIGQRLHEDDICGFLASGGSGEKWTVLTVPVLDEDGNSIWEEMYPAEEMRILEAADPYTFSSQFMQQPSPPTGGMFETDRIEIVDALPAGIKLVRAWDPAYTNKATSCDTAGALLGVFEGIVYISDISFRKTSNPDDMVVATAQVDGHDVTVLYPQDPGAGVKVLADLTKRMHGYDLRSHKPTSDKVEAWLPFASQVNGRNVRLVRGEWNRDFLNDLRMAPFGKRKDLIDAASYGYQHLALTEDSAMDAFLSGKARA